MDRFDEMLCWECLHKGEMHSTRPGGLVCSGNSTNGAPCECPHDSETVAMHCVQLFEAALTGSVESIFTLIYALDGRPHSGPIMPMVLGKSEVSEEEIVDDFLHSDRGGEMWLALLARDGYDSEDPASLRMLDLCSTFRSLDKCVEEMTWSGGWSPSHLERWAYMEASEGGKLAAQFVLGAWDRGREWACGNFDLFAAQKTWDKSHWAALTAWTRSPWTA